MMNSEIMFLAWSLAVRVNALGVTLALLTLTGSSSLVYGGEAYSEAEARSVLTSDEKKIQEIRQEEIAQLKLTLSRRLPQSRRADLYLRLAELYIEAYRAEFLTEGRIHHERLSRGLSEKTIQRTRSRPYLGMAIRACQEIIDFKIPYDKMDQVLYFLAYNYNELGNPAKSREYYSELIRRYPKTGFAVEGLRELGEAAFQARDFRLALNYFENVLEKAVDHSGFKDQLPRVYQRLAWCHYRLKQYSRAIKEMKEAIRLSGQGQEKLLSVKEEALRDLAIFMTEAGNVEEAISYFKSVAGDQTFYPRVLESLARQYERSVEPEKASQVYEGLLKTTTDDEMIFRVVVKLVDLDLRRARFQQAAARVRSAKLFSKSDGETLNSWQNLRAMLRRTATENHGKYRKTSDRRALDFAEQFYALYLESILALSDPRNETPEIQMYLADVKREKGLSKEASKLYKKVTEGGDKRYAKEAASLWTASLAEAIRKEAISGKDASKGEGARTKATELELEFVRAADDLGRSLKDTVEAREARLKAAQVLAAYPESQKEAFKRIESLIQDSPKTVQAITAARLWLQIYSDRLAKSEKKEKAGKEAQNDAAEIQELIQDLRGFSDLLVFDRENGSKLQTALMEQENRVKVLEISFKEKKQDYRGAAKLYDRYATEAKSKDISDKAFQNSFSSWMKANDFENARRSLQEWQQKVPDSKMISAAMRDLATLSFIRGDFDQSAQDLERLASHTRDAESSFLAARIRVALAKKGEDLSIVTEAFVRQFPKSPLGSKLFLIQALKSEADGQLGFAQKAYRRCLSLGQGDDELECVVRLALVEKNNGNISESQSLFRKATLGGAKRSGGYFSLLASYELARAADEKLSFPRLTKEGLSKELPKRLKSFELLQKAYSPVLESGGVFSVNASHRLGQVALDLAKEMEEISSGDKKVTQVVNALRDTALQFFKQSRQKAMANEWFSPVLPLIALDLSFSEKRPAAHGALPELKVARLSGVAGEELPADSLRGKLMESSKDAALWLKYAHWLSEDFSNDALAMIAAERALAIQPKSSAALNDLVVYKVKASAKGVEDPWMATQVAGSLKEALNGDGDLNSARWNRAQLLNYYGMHAAAKGLVDLVSIKDATPGVSEALGIVLQSSGKPEEAKRFFQKARDSGSSQASFTQVFHEAAVVGLKNPQNCVDLLGSAEEPKGSFEKLALKKLQEACESWVRKFNSN